MTEGQADYIKDALEMAGLSKPKEIIHEISGFTPAFDVLILKYADPITALVFGKAWRFCQMEDSVCKASLATIGTELGLDKSTVSRHIQTLVSDGYLVDLTPGLRNKPHVYADAGKIIMRTATSAGVAQNNAKRPRVAQSNSSVAQNNAGVAQNALTKVLKKDSEEREIAPAPDFESMTIEQARQWPTLKLYREATGWMPGSLIWASVDQAIREHNLGGPQIKAAAEAWELAGHRRENVGGILEWAIKGAGGQAPQRNARREKTPEEVNAEYPTLNRQHE